MFFGNRKNKLIVFSLFFSIFLFSEGVFAAETGIVPCGHSAPCTLCHLIVGIHNLVDWGLKLLIVAALAAITIAGVMYVVSAGSDTMMTTAKNFVRSSVTGFAFVLGAWLIVSVTMWLISTKADLGIGKAGWHNGSITYDCSTQSSALTGSNATAMTKEGCEKWCDEAQGDSAWTAKCKEGCPKNGQPITGTGEGLTQADAKKALDDCGVKYASTNTLGGLRDTTIQEACNFKSASSCSPQITTHGGTNGNHASGTYSHANGYKLDYAINSCLDNYIQSNYNSKGIRSDGAKMYQSASGACYAREGDHWDISTASCPPSRG